jgi:hypothetical protein
MDLFSLRSIQDEYRNELIFYGNILMYYKVSNLKLPELYLSHQPERNVFSSFPNNYHVKITIIFIFSHKNHME